MSLIQTARRLIAAPAVIIRKPGPRFTGRARTRDIAFPYRMGAGFPGMPNRSHPMSIVARMMDAAAPVLYYGVPVILETNGTVRPFTVGDTALTDCYGVSVRPYPVQDPGTSHAFGAQNVGPATPPANQPLDILISGHIMVSVLGTPQQGGAAHVWCAASAGNHIQSQFETAAAGGSTADLTWDKTFWHSGGDSSGQANGLNAAAQVAELAFNI